MKQLIQEATRFKKLANIKEAIPSSTKPSDYSQVRPDLQIDKLKGGIVFPDNFINTPDEKSIAQFLDTNASLEQKLSKINNVAELDGLFKIILDKTSLMDVSKTQVIAALSKALKGLSGSTTISTGKINKK